MTCTTSISFTPILLGLIFALALCSWDHRATSKQETEKPEPRRTTMTMNPNEVRDALARLQDLRRQQANIEFACGLAAILLCGVVTLAPLAVLWSQQ